MFTIHSSAPLAAALLTLAWTTTVAADVTSHPGANCEAWALQKTTPTSDGGIVALDLDPVDLVCPFATTAVEHASGARVFLSTYRHNACTLKTVDPVNGTVFATRVVRDLPIGPGLFTTAEPIELEIPHAFTAGPHATRSLACTLPGMLPETNIPTVPQHPGAFAELRSYSLETTKSPGLSTRLEDLERILAAQPVDHAWAIDREKALRTLGESESEASAIELGRVECRTSLCRVDYEAPTRAAIEDFEQSALSAGSSIRRESGREDAWIEGRWQGRLFVSRDGFGLFEAAD
ncbi:MAG: hypothetical protein R3F21_23235 [Myxococcota bacterium]